MTKNPAQPEEYVSRAALKLDSIANLLGLNFDGKTVLDVGSSTGGFTDFALRHGAAKIIAVDLGTKQMHPSLRINPKIELHEQTDIRSIKSTTSNIDIVLIDVSFISMREILPTIFRISTLKTQVVAMLKPQFEAVSLEKNHGIIKNDRIRRQLLKDFEAWVKRYFVITDKADSKIAGSKGNIERFYLLQKH